MDTDLERIARMEEKLSNLDTKVTRLDEKIDNINDLKVSFAVLKGQVGFIAAIITFVGNGLFILAAKLITAMSGTHT